MFFLERMLQRAGTRTGPVPPLVAVLLVLAGVLSLAPAAAFAHAALIGTEPEDGAVLAQAPKEFKVTFNEPVSPLVLTLVKPDGTPERLTSFRLDGDTLDIDCPEGLGQGTHVLSWRVISADGHPVGSSILFSVGQATAAPAVSEAVDWPLRIAILAGKVLLYVGLFFGIGGALALAWLAGGGRDGRAVTLGALLAGLAAAPVSLGLQGLDALGAPLSHFAEADIWHTAWGTTFGWTVLIALGALGLALLSLFMPRGSGALSLLALFGVGASLAASGHASAAEPQWLTRPMVFLHGCGIALWIGALPPLGLALYRGSPGSAVFLARFSRAIPWVLAALVIAGLVLAVIQVQTPAALVHTDYGRLLLAKLALLAILFVLAAVNRWKLTGPAEAGDTGARRGLARSVVAETLLAVAIFTVAAGWRFTPPPRALVIAAAQPASLHIHTLKAMADVKFTPGHAGPMAASMVLMTGDFGPLDAKEVTLVLSKPDSGIEPVKWKAMKPGDGTWRIDNLTIPIAGRWTVRLDILVSDFDMVQIQAPVDIRPEP